MLVNMAMQCAGQWSQGQGPRSKHCIMAKHCNMAGTRVLRPVLLQMKQPPLYPLGGKRAGAPPRGSYQNAKPRELPCLPYSYGRLMGIMG